MLRSVEKTPGVIEVTIDEQHRLPQVAAIGRLPSVGDVGEERCSVFLKTTLNATSKKCMDERETSIARWKELTERTLPALAREGHWPLRFDHCFKRVCLDHAFRDVWYKHVPRPAERHIGREPLNRAICCAEKIAAGGIATLRQRNAQSLAWRGKERG